MPEIVSLRDYHEHIDELLDERRFDEVIFHCQHILQQRPKDIGAYRRLGRAFIALDQWEETGEVLRRVLSVSPDDLQAHLGLSRVYHYTKKPIQAIWHLERAWEHEPNNVAMSDELRQMYFIHRKIEDARLQLTVGAAARQYARNGLYDQAISLLANTLRQARDRVDLRLLLARTQREGGHGVDAAETALDIVAILPDCVEANSILAELWLQEKRPSDAQRYLSRIEAVDPYLAVQLVTNRPTTQEFDVILGDYQTVATRQSTQIQPDWLTALGDNDDDLAPDDDFFTNLLDDEEPTEEENQASPLSRQSGLLGALPQTSEWADQDQDHDWLIDEVDAQTELSIDINRQATGLTGLLTSLDEGDSALAGDNEFDLPSMDEFFDDDQQEDDPLAWLNQTDNDEETTTTSDEDDPFSWLKESGIEVDEDSQDVRFSHAPIDDGPTNFSTDIAADPMAWLKESGHEVIEDDDRMAWLNETDDDDAFEFFTEPASEQSPIEQQTPSFDNTFDDDDESFLDEMLAMEDLFAENEDSNEVSFAQITQEDTPPTFDLDDDADETDESADPLGWLNQTSDDEDDEDSASETDTPSWLMGEDTADAEDFTFDLDDDADETDESADPLGWLNQTSDDEDDDDSASETDTPSWLVGEDTADAEDFTFDLDDDADETDESADPLGWLNQASDDEDEDSASETDTPSWLVGEDTADAEDFTFDLDDDADETDESADPLGWLNQASNDEEDDDSASETDTSSWLVGEDTADAADFTFDLDDDADETDESADPLGWLNQTSDDEEDDDSASETDTPSWLTQNESLDIEGVLDEPLFAKEDIEEPAYWQIGDEKQDDTFSFDVDDAPDWLDDVLDEDINELEIENLETSVLKSTDWLAGIADSDPDELSVESEIADELTSFDFADEQVGSVEEDFAWLNILQEPEEQSVVEEISQPTEEQDASPVPAWLSSDNDNEGEELDLFIEPDPKAEPESTDDETENTPDWLLSDDESDDLEDLFAFEEQTPAETFSFTESGDDTPDWLSDLENQADDESESEFDFLSESETSVEAVSETPDWLLEEEDADDEAESEFDFFTEPETSVEAVSETPDWLLEEDADDDEAESEFDFFTESEPSVEAVSETPDWLLEDDADDEAVSEFDFLSESEPSVKAVSETPDWLLEDDADDEAESEFDFFTEPETSAEAVSETPEWLLEDDADDEAESEFDFFTEPETSVEAVSETPDWLLEDDDVDDEAEHIEEDYNVLGETEDHPVEAVSETPDWLLEDDDADDESKSEFDFFAEPETSVEAVSETPDWLLEDDADDEAESEFDFVTEPETSVEAVSETPDWLLEDDADDDEAESEFDFLSESETSVEAVSETPDWLLEDDDADDEAEHIEEDYNVLGETEDHPVEAVSETPDWLLEDDADDDQLEELEFIPDLSDSDTDPDLEDEFSEDHAPVAAQNAPDWLNAMVPGFDVDFEADEDTPIESEFLTASKQAAVAREAASVDFGWLDEIVEAEMYQPPAISLDALPGLSKPEAQPEPTTPEPDAPTKRSRFSFSRPPVGLREKVEPKPAPTTDVDDLPDWLTEDNKSPDIDNDFFSDEALLDETDLFSDDIFAGSIEGDRFAFDKDDDDDNDDDLFDDDDDLFTPRG